MDWITAIIDVGTQAVGGVGQILSAAFEAVQTIFFNPATADGTVTPTFIGGLLLFTAFGGIVYYGFGFIKSLLRGLGRK